VWDFGDGTQSTEKDPEHIYTGIGAYLVSLTVTTSGGETDTMTLNDYVIVMESNRTTIGPEGGSVTSTQGAIYTVDQGMFNYETVVHICDVPERLVHRKIPTNVPYHGAVAVFITTDSSVKSEGFYGTIDIPLHEPLSPEDVLDVYILGSTFVESRLLDIKAIVNADGTTAKLITNKLGTPDVPGTFVVRANVEHSMPRVGPIDAKEKES
jgi:PKD repeat protein